MRNESLWRWLKRSLFERETYRVLTEIIDEGFDEGNFTEVGPPEGES